MALVTTEQQLVGTLMCNPKLLLQTDKYQISTKDFEHPLYRVIFWAVDNLAPTATGQLAVHEIEQWIFNSPTCKATYEKYSSSPTLLMDMRETNISSFDMTYLRFKRENLIKDLKKWGYDTTKYYSDETQTPEQIAINDKFSESNAQEILKSIEADFNKLKTNYIAGDSSAVHDIFDGLEAMLEELSESPEVGLPLQGILFNHIVSGAIPGRFYLRSGSSGLGKTRSITADACQLAFPIKYDWNLNTWIQVGNCEKVLVIITEQNFDEIQKMALAYLTGINESKIKKNKCNEKERMILKQAIEVFKIFKENFHIVRMPSPTISMVKQVVREQVLLHDIQYVFYDYIFVCPSLLGEFKGAALRNDEILLMFSDALKQLAVELDVFVMSSTQVNAKADQSGDIRNEAALAGSRAVINKADVGCIMARPTKEELKTLEPIIEQTQGIVPNVVTDIYKLRGGENTQTRIWSYIDLGTLSRNDLFVTDSRMDVVHLDYEKYNFTVDDERVKPLLDKLRKGQV